MYIIISENISKIFDVKIKEFIPIVDSSEDVMKNSNNNLIFDKNIVDFSLETLKNCSRLDAYKILNCRNAIKENNSEINLIVQEKTKFFKKLKSISLFGTSVSISYRRDDVFRHARTSNIP